MHAKDFARYAGNFKTPQAACDELARSVGLLNELLAKAGEAERFNIAHDGSNLIIDLKTSAGTTEVLTLNTNNKLSATATLQSLAFTEDGSFPQVTAANLFHIFDVARFGRRPRGDSITGVFQAARDTLADSLGTGTAARLAGEKSQNILVQAVLDRMTASSRYTLRMLSDDMGRNNDLLKAAGISCEFIFMRTGRHMMVGKDEEGALTEIMELTFDHDPDLQTIQIRQNGKEYEFMPDQAPAQVEARLHAALSEPARDALAHQKRFTP